VTYLFDTDVCVDYLRGRSPRLAKRLDACDPSGLRLCVATEARPGVPGASRHADDAPVTSRLKGNTS